MARAARARSGPSWGSLIVFIVLCIVLVLGYIPVSMALAKRVQALNGLQKDIKEILENPLGPALRVQAQSAATSGEAVYGRAFFQPIASAAQKGLLYDEFLTVAGYVGEQPAKALAEEFSLEPEKGKTLRQYILDQRTELNNKQIEVSKAQRAEKDANDRYDAVRAQMQEIRKSLDDERAKYAKDLAAARTAYTTQVNEYKKQWEQANKEMKDWFQKHQELTTQYDAFKKTSADEVGALQTQVAELKTELARKKPKPVKVTEGVVLNADVVSGFAIINLGAREKIETGEKFTVMRIGKGGKREPKGELQVVRVDSLVSRADILSQDENNYIMAGDVVERQKTEVEAEP